jgi:hypothetical protein
MFELYEKTIHVSRLYKLAGNLPLADKYRKDAEKVYTELQQIEDKVEKVWRRKHDWMDAKFGRNGSKDFVGPVWDRVTKGRHTLPTSGHLEGPASAKTSSDGGRKKKTRKNKVLHKR